MDVHSRHLQFNQRKPRGPPVRPEVKSQKHVAFKDPKRDHRDYPLSENMTMEQGERPIKTNSRVLKSENYKKSMYLTFVNNAFSEKALGNQEPYNELLDQFNFRANQSNPTSVAQLRLWISALSNVVSKLDSRYAKLVESILSLPWSTLDTTFVKVYIHFVGLLVSARPEYLVSTLEKCVEGFRYEFNFHEHAVKLAETSSSTVSRRVVYDRHHALIQHLLHLVPTLPSTLQPLLVKCFPHKRLSKPSQTTYIRNLLRLVGYCPSLSERVFSHLIERMIQMDVEIQLEIEELDEADEQKDDQLAEIFDLDPFDTVATTQDDSSNDEGDESTEQGDFDNFSDVSSEANDLNEDVPRKVEEHVNYPHIRDMVEKLDAVMGIMFEYFESAQITKTAPGRPGSPSIVLEQETHALTDGDVHTHKTIQFFNLLAVFNNLILKTLRSRYTQFLLFWYTSQDAQYLDVFQGMLISKAFLEQDNPVVLRISAISYIASFVSRAQFVDRGHTRHIVRLFRQHLEDQLEYAASEGSSRPNSAQYPTFYAVSQALFLIFCFRWRDLLDESECTEDMAALGGAALGARKWQSDLQVLPKIVNSVLNPLKVCSSNVVEQFALVAHRTGFMYVYPIMEANKRTEYQGVGSSGLLVSEDSLGSNLNSFFPFDPYRLPTSQKWLQDIYREWSSVAIEEIGEADDEDVEEQDQDHPIGRPVLGSTRSTGELGQSFEAMSISPNKATIAACVNQSE